MNTTQRNKLAKEFITDKLSFVSQLSEEDFEDIPEYPLLKKTLKSLIDVNAKGFRGIVATAITGKFLDPNYDPLNNFYGCNPRSIFEQGIFYAFENRIPCGKSDPLNVAKNINVLDDEWAKGKRPQSAAKAAVDYIRHIEKNRSPIQEKIINYFFFKLLQYADSVASIKINISTQTTIPNQVFGHKLLQFTLKYPESGTVPQFVISKILRQLYGKSLINVEGGDESVFGTNTTSKKPADIWLELSKTPYNLFEITVKKIDGKRLDDCIQSLNSVGQIDNQITFICRFPDDISSLNGVQDGALNYKGKIFNFVDIKAFIPSIVTLLSEDDIKEILKEFKIFIEDINRPITTKDGWMEIFNNT